MATKTCFSTGHSSNESLSDISLDGNLNRSNLTRRTSLKKQNQEKRAKKIKFFRNGDKYHKGHLYVLSTDRIRTFNALLEDLTRIMENKISLPRGVWYLFFAETGEKVTELWQLIDNERYVCSSTDNFIKLDYVANEKRRLTVTRSGDESFHKWSDSPKPCEPRDFVKPKLVTIIRNGLKPRKLTRILLNRKTAHSFEQVLNDITSAIKLDTGAVRKVYSLEGKQVLSLADFFGDEDTFVAYGSEKFSLDGLDLDAEEMKVLNHSNRCNMSIHKLRHSSSESPIGKLNTSLSGRSFREGSPTPSNASSVSSNTSVVNGNKDDRLDYLAGS